MKLIDFTNIALGQELSPSFSKQTQDGFLSALTGLVKGAINGAAGIIVIDGCVMTKVGDQYDQTAGFVYYNGEILTVDVFAGNSAVNVPVFQAPANTFTQQAWYGDGVKRDTLYTRKLPMVMGASGSGIADYTDLVSLRKAVRLMLDLSKEISTDTKVADYVLVLTDAGKNIKMNLAVANNVQLPSNSSQPFPVGTQILITQGGAGKTSINPEGGVTIRSDGGITSISAQYAGAALLKTGINEWYLYGALGV